MTLTSSPDSEKIIIIKKRPRWCLIAPKLYRRRRKKKESHAKSYRETAWTTPSTNTSTVCVLKKKKREKQNVQTPHRSPPTWDNYRRGLSLAGTVYSSGPSSPMEAFRAGGERSSRCVQRLRRVSEWREFFFVFLFFSCRVRVPHMEVELRVEIFKFTIVWADFFVVCCFLIFIKEKT